jgi:hypothetical protein
MAAKFLLAALLLAPSVLGRALPEAGLNVIDERELAYVCSSLTELDYHINACCRLRKPSTWRSEASSRCSLICLLVPRMMSRRMSRKMLRRRLTRMA